MPNLTEIDGVGPALAAAFVKNNYLTIAKIAISEPVELSTVPGISNKGATLIIASAKTLLEKSLSQKDVRKKTAKTVAPLKIRANISSKTNEDKGKKGKIGKVKNPKLNKGKNHKNDKNIKQKEKIKNLKRTIKKLKKEKKKLVAKYKNKAKKGQKNPITQSNRNAEVEWIE